MVEGKVVTATPKVENQKTTQQVATPQQQLSQVVNKQPTVVNSQIPNTQTKVANMAVNNNQSQPIPVVQPNNVQPNVVNTQPQISQNPTIVGTTNI